MTNTQTKLALYTLISTLAFSYGAYAHPRDKTDCNTLDNISCSQVKSCYWEGTSSGSCKVGPPCYLATTQEKCVSLKNTKGQGRCAWASWIPTCAHIAGTY